MPIQFTNDATTFLAANIDAATTSITVVDASSFPTLGVDDYTYVTLAPIDNATREIVKCTAITGNTLTVVRAQEGTTAASFTTEDRAQIRITAQLFRDIMLAYSSLDSYRYIATANQTIFSGADTLSATLAYLQNNIIVLLNGVVLGTNDYTATDGSTVELGVGSTEGDELTIVAFTSFQTTSVYTQAQVDTLHIGPAGPVGPVGPVGPAGSAYVLLHSTTVTTGVTEITYPAAIIGSYDSYLIRLTNPRSSSAGTDGHLYISLSENSVYNPLYHRTAYKEFFNAGMIYSTGSISSGPVFIRDINSSSGIYAISIEILNAQSTDAKFLKSNVVQRTWQGLREIDNITIFNPNSDSSFNYPATSHALDGIKLRLGGYSNGTGQMTGTFSLYGIQS